VSDAAVPRLAPIPSDQWGDDAKAALLAAFPEQVVARFVATGPDAAPVPNVLATLMHHPALAGPFLAYNQVLLQSPALDARWRELMILRVAWRTRSRYEWVQHARLAARLGITDDEIAAIADGAPLEWPPLERALLDATDELVDHYCVADDTWKRLAEHLDEVQLVELVFVVGTYVGLAMAFNSFGLQIDPELQEFSQTLPAFEE
jgi:4-carboxymuconolactone decarboxylase